MILKSWDGVVVSGTVRVSVVSVMRVVKGTW